MALGALALLLGCASPPQVAPGVVRMLDNRFEPVELTVAVGDTVTFVGAGHQPHNAVATDDSWSTEDAFGSLEMFEGDEATVVFDAAGEYPFYCTFHGNRDGAGMAGTVTVVPGDSG